MREVAADASSLIEGDVYVLDKGTKVLQFNTKASAGKEKFRAAEFVRTLVSPRQGHCDITVYGQVIFTLLNIRSLMLLGR